MNARASFFSLVIDTHVHFYPHFDLSEFLEHTYTNLESVSKRMFPLQDSVKIIYLMNAPQCAGYDLFLHLASTEPLCEWEIALVSDQKTLVARHLLSNRHIWICPAYQYTHTNGLEVLCLGLSHLHEAHASLSELIFEVLSLGGIPVLAYGFGKWKRKLEKTLKHLIDDFKETSLCVGDSPSRSVPFLNTPLMNHAKQAQVRIFPGSDPLPLSGEECVSGSNGVIIPDVALELQNLSHSLSQILRDPLVRFLPFTSKKPLWRNYIQQALMQVRSRKFKNANPADMQKACLEKWSPDLHSSSRDYETRFHGQAGKWFLHVQGRVVQLMSRCVVDKQILDVGGAHGQLITYYLTEKFRITVFASYGSPKECVEEYLSKKNIEWVEGSLWHLPFENRSFPLVVSIRMCAHMPNTKAWIKELCRVSQDTVIIDASMMLSFNIFSFLFFPLKKMLEPNTREYKLFKLGHLKHWFEAEGFYLDTHEKQFFWPMAIHRKLNDAVRSEKIEAACKRLGLTRLLGSPAILCFRRKTLS